MGKIVIVGSFGHTAAAIEAENIDAGADGLADFSGDALERDQTAPSGHSEFDNGDARQAQSLGKSRSGENSERIGGMGGNVVGDSGLDGSDGAAPPSRVRRGTLQALPIDG